VTVVQTVTQPPRLLSQASPTYPETAREEGIEGDVLVAMVVDTTGRVSEVEILRGPLLFHDAARAAAHSSIFAPARVNGMPVSFRVIQRLTFQLQAAQAVAPALPLWEADVPPVLMNEDILRSPRLKLSSEAYGDVLVEVIVEPSGIVSRATLLMGSLTVFEAARAALYGLGYTPPKRANVATRVAIVALVRVRQSAIELDVRNGDSPLYGYWEVDTKPVFFGQPASRYHATVGTESPTGEVSLGTIIDTTGVVEVAWVVQGPTALHEAALDTARVFRCLPARHEGRPVRVWLTRHISFSRRQSSWDSGE
jgi:TonB family protein